MTISNLLSQRARLEREKYSSNFLLFLREVLGYVDIVDKTHYPIVEVLTDPTKRFKMFLLPRGGLKTSICSIGYSIWSLTKNPELRILIDSKTLDRSKMILFAIKEHLEFGERFRELYGEWKSLPGWQESSITIPFRTQAHKEPSVQTGGVDSPQTGGHYDLIIADDLHDEKNVESEASRNKVILHWKTLFPILEPDGEMIVVGTRWHWDDLYGYILKTEGITRV